jgi:hypothetical protein
MRIQIIFFKPNHNHTRIIEEKENYTGNYALETMILKLLERHYSPKVSEEVKRILTNKAIEE